MAHETFAEGRAFLELSHICAGYGRKQVLKDISFRASSGQLTGLLGPNGCGKTTLLKALCRQLSCSGSCLLKGRPLDGLTARQLARQISYIPQRSGISISLSVLEVVLMGFNPVLGVLERPSGAQTVKAREALKMVGLESRTDTDYQKLSEGQKQLCILARTMVEDASLLLLDEPESSLDFPHRHHIMKLLKSMTENAGNDNPRAALVTLHAPELALEYCEQLVLLRDGTCTAVLHPATDTIPYMETALSQIYGPVHLYEVETSGGRRLVMFPG